MQPVNIVVALYRVYVSGLGREDWMCFERFEVRPTWTRVGLQQPAINKPGISVSRDDSVPLKGLC